MPKRDAKAVWRGSLREGDGTLALGSGAFEGAYSLKLTTRRAPSRDHYLASKR